MEFWNVMIAIYFAIISFPEVKSLPLRTDDKMEKTSLLVDLQSNKRSSGASFVGENVKSLPGASLVTEDQKSLHHDTLDSTASISMEDDAPSHPMLKKVPRRHLRRRRSYGTKTICIPVRKETCKIYTYGGISKNFCVKKTQIICTALD